MRSSRSAATTRSASRTSSRTPASPSWACRRRSTTTCRPPRSRSASTPRCRSRPTRSTVSTRRPSRTTGSSSARSWAATPAGSRCTRASPAVPPRSSSPRSRSTSTRCAAQHHGSVTARVATRRSSWWPRARCRRKAPSRSPAARSTPFGHVALGGIGQRGGRALEARTGYETRVDRTRPRPARRNADRVRPRAGHPLRAPGHRRRPRAAPSATMVALKGDVIELVPLGDAVTESKIVGPAFLGEAAVFFG